MGVACTNFKPHLFENRSETSAQPCTYESMQNWFALLGNDSAQVETFKNWNAKLPLQIF